MFVSEFRREIRELGYSWEAFCQRISESGTFDPWLFVADSSDFPSAVMEAFVWKETREGHDFWAGLVEKYKEKNFYAKETNIF